MSVVETSSTLAGRSIRQHALDPLALLPSRSPDQVVRQQAEDDRKSGDAERDEEQWQVRVLESRRDDYDEEKRDVQDEGEEIGQEEQVGGVGELGRSVEVSCG